MAECWKQRESSKRDGSKSSGAVEWANWEPVFREDMDAQGAKAVFLSWIDTDKGDAGRPSCGFRLVVREINKAMKKSDFP